MDTITHIRRLWDFAGAAHLYLIGTDVYVVTSAIVAGDTERYEMMLFAADEFGEVTDWNNLFTCYDSTRHHFDVVTEYVLGSQ